MDAKTSASQMRRARKCANTSGPEDHEKQAVDGTGMATIGKAFVPATSAEKRSALETIRDAHPGNAGVTQEQRLLEALGAWAISTFEASRLLDCYDPRARVMALRRKGHAIVMTWSHVPTECGRLHRIGIYTLRKG